MNDDFVTYESLPSMRATYLSLLKDMWPILLLAIGAWVALASFIAMLIYVLVKALA